MISLPPSVRIFLATTPTDMRKGHDGLAALVQQQMGQDVYSGHLFVFVSRRGNRIKILCWDKGGFVLWYKRLERGRFRLPHVSEEGEVLQLESSELSMLVDGIDYSRVRKPPRWGPPQGVKWAPGKKSPRDAKKAVERSRYAAGEQPTGTARWGHSCVRPRNES